MIISAKIIFKILENGGKKQIIYKKSLSIKIIHVEMTKPLKISMMKFYKNFGVKYR